MEVYAFKDTINYISSSGGAFKAIVESIKTEYNSVVVYGAAFDDTFGVRHIRAVEEEDIQRVYGSKYVRSDFSGIPSMVLSDLKKGKKVIFSGTPCQVAIIKKQIENNKLSFDNILLVDIICHGTIKPNLWEKFVEWIQKKEKAKLIDFSFRYKKTKWKSYPTMAVFDNGRKCINTFRLRRYTEIFFSDLALMEGCYKCPYAKVERISDITIGDFWGIRKIIPSFPFREEVSQVIVNSQKGKRIFDSVRGKSHYLIEKCKQESFYHYQQALNGPVKRKEKCSEFWEYYSEHSFEETIKKYGGYNFIGLIKHTTQKMLGEMGIINIIKDIIKR